MKKLKIYLDTSVINFLFADDAPMYQQITKDFFNHYLNEYEVYISEIVYVEIQKTKNTVIKDRLLSIIKEYDIEIYDNLYPEIELLARLYVSSGIIPQQKLADALHIAYATYYEFDILLSWNFKHLANIKKQMAINAINESQGYSKKLFLTNPMEVTFEKPV